MKYFLIAGEASGDLHGSNLIKHLKLADNNAEIVCWGGDRMEAAGALLLKHYRSLAFMGFWEVLINIRSVFRNLNNCKAQIEEFSPDVVIMIDYPGFNLRIAKFLKNRLARSYYYISPKVWAWKRSRIKSLRKFVDRMYVIFPFEVDFFRGYDYPVYYFGNPLVESVSGELNNAAGRKEFIDDNRLEDKPIIALLPGSRLQEIKKILPQMADLERYYVDYQFVIAAINSIPLNVYEEIVQNTGARIVVDQTFSLLKNCDAALVTSGTASLETALAGVPQIVCYSTSWLTYKIASIILSIRFISLVNLIMDKQVVRELIQNELTVKNIRDEIEIILPGGWKRGIMMQNYKQLIEILKGEGASEKVAKDIYNSILLTGNVN